MPINIGDVVNVTLPTGLLNQYEIVSTPGNNQVYWEMFPVGKPDEVTIVGPSMLVMIKLK